MVKQGSDEWKAEKLACITGTRAYSLMKSNTTRATLMSELIAELVAGSYKESYQTKSMQRGIDIEPQAIAEYELLTGRIVNNRADFIKASFSPYVGFSPDGITNDNGLYEGKRLDEHNHIKLLCGGRYDEKYYWQCQYGMFLCELDYADLHHYCETLPHTMKNYIITFDRDEEVMKKIKTVLNNFLDELNHNIDKFEIGFNFEEAA